MDRGSIIASFKGADSYAAFFESFRQPQRIAVDLNGQLVSEALYFQVCKLHYAGWKHRVEFKRGQKHGLADIFQDLVAFHLRLCLPAEYTLHLEEKLNKVRPDILIRKGNTAIGALEVKTTIGWARPDAKAPEPYAAFQKRIADVSTAFDIPPGNVLYIFENHSNVTAAFSDQFWNKAAGSPRVRPTTFPHSIIHPLFNASDPYYWSDWPAGTRDSSYHELSDTMILERAARCIVSPIEDVAKKILAMSA